MGCYKSGGCGEYEGLSCKDCPASNPNYKDVVVDLKNEQCKSHNNFFDIINSPLMKTENVIRFSGTYQINQELLSTHIVDVQMISLIIARNMINNGERVDVGLLLQKGLIHDVDEVLVGDIPRLTKYSSSECHDSLNAVAESVVHDISNKLDKSDFILNIWKNAKDYTIEGYILKLADMISVAKKTSQEISMLNNNNFLKVAIEMMNYIHDLYNSVPVDLIYIPENIKYVRTLLINIENYFVDTIRNHQDVIDKFGIENTAVKYIVEHRYKE